MDNQTLTPWEDLLDRLFLLDYSDTSELLEVEQQIYAALQKQPNHIEGLILLMFQQIMSGNRAKAQALAYKIWEIGGNLEPFMEMIYIECLLNLGLIDMASVLLKPRFETLRENLDDFYPVLVKFAVMTGSVPLLNRMAAYPEAAGEDEVLFDVAGMYAAAHNAEHFKNIQKLILEHAVEYLCSYEYNLYDDEDIPELEIVLYVAFDPSFCAKMEQNIRQKITAYLNSAHVTGLDNLHIKVLNIRNHEAWDLSSPEDEEEREPNSWEPTDSNW